MSQLHIRTQKYLRHRAIIRTKRAMVIEFKQAIGVRVKFKQKKSNRVGWEGKSCGCRSGAYNIKFWFKLCLNWAIHGSIHGNTKSNI
jgi:hypothetical protein